MDVIPCVWGGKLRSLEMAFAFASSAENMIRKYREMLQYGSVLWRERGSLLWSIALKKLGWRWYLQLPLSWFVGIR
jgi:hypothetical protein